jgi:hypothetical protein
MEVAMAKTHPFSLKSGGRSVTVALAHVILFERDELPNAR